jgi:hypothetical protein
MLIASDFTGAVSVIQFWDDKVSVDCSGIRKHMAANLELRQTQDGTSWPS